MGDNPDAQRIQRRAGSNPAEAEEHSKAAAGKQALGRQEGELEAQQVRSPDEPVPMAEAEDGPPRPRR